MCERLRAEVQHRSEDLTSCCKGDSERSLYLWSRAGAAFMGNVCERRVGARFDCGAMAKLTMVVDTKDGRGPDIFHS